MQICFYNPFELTEARMFCEEVFREDCLSVFCEFRSGRADQSNEGTRSVSDRGVFFGLRFLHEQKR